MFFKDPETEQPITNAASCKNCSAKMLEINKCSRYTKIYTLITQQFSLHSHFLSVGWQQESIEIKYEKKDKSNCVHVNVYIPKLLNSSNTLQKALTSSLMKKLKALIVWCLSITCKDQIGMHTKCWAGRGKKQTKKTTALHIN